MPGTCEGMKYNITGSMPIGEGDWRVAMSGLDSGPEFWASHRLVTFLLPEGYVAPENALEPGGVWRLSRDGRERVKRGLPPAFRRSPVMRREVAAAPNEPLSMTSVGKGTGYAPIAPVLEDGYILVECPAHGCGQVNEVTYALLRGPEPRAGRGAAVKQREISVGAQKTRAKPS